MNDTYLRIFLIVILNISSSDPKIPPVLKLPAGKLFFGNIHPLTICCIVTLFFAGYPIVPLKKPGEEDSGEVSGETLSNLSTFYNS